MAVPAWPIAALFPQSPTFEGNNVALGENRVRFQPDVGRPQLRRRSTARDDEVVWNFYCSRTQLNNFLDWYKNTVFDGSLSFTYLDPTVNTTYTFQFVEPPSYQFVGGLLAQLAMKLKRFGT